MSEIGRTRLNRTRLDLSDFVTPLPSNRVGETLEKRKDYRGVLGAYVRSLQVEWNQPPIIEARKRLEKLLAGRNRGR